MILRVLICSGLDPTGRAGLLADVATVTLLEARAAGVATSLTAQGTRFRSEKVAAPLLRDQLQGAIKTGPVHAVKLGMIPDRGTLLLISQVLRPLGVPVVIDPVVRSSKGEKLSSLTPADYLDARLNAVLTPNREELAWFGLTPKQLLKHFTGLVVKGGASASDEVWSQSGPKLLRGAILPRSGAHRGTGCRFASALAVGLAQGKPLLSATRTARTTVRAYLKTSL